MEKERRVVEARRMAQDRKMEEEGRGMEAQQDRDRRMGASLSPEVQERRIAEGVRRVAEEGRMEEERRAAGDRVHEERDREWARRCKPETRNPKPENLIPETRNPKPETRNPKPSSRWEELQRAEQARAHPVAPAPAGLLPPQAYYNPHFLPGGSSREGMQAPEGRVEEERVMRERRRIEERREEAR